MIDAEIDFPAWAEGQDRRGDARVRTLFQVARVLIGEGDEAEQQLCLIRNISPGGLLLETFKPLPVGTRVRIEPKSCDALDGSVRWMKGKYAGIQFDRRIDLEYYLRGRHDLDAAQMPRAPRITVTTPARLLVGPIWYVVQLCDVSQFGAKIEGDLPLADVEGVTLHINGLAPRSARVIWCRGGRAGLEFATAISFVDLAHWVNFRARADEAA